MEAVDPRAFFDTYPRFVDSSETGHWRERLNARQYALVHRQRSQLAGARVLDLASHDGRFTFAALAHGAAHAVGVERSRDLVAASWANLQHYGVDSDRFDFVQSDLFEFLDRAEGFDVVFCFGILYHVNHHMLLLSRIAALEPRLLVVDSRISVLEGSVIEVRSPMGASPPVPGNDLEGQPTRAALDAMLSYFGWTYEYVDWAASGLTELPHTGDYRAGSRVSVVVDCHSTRIPHDVREQAVQAVFDRQRHRKTVWLTVKEVAAELGLVPHGLRFWVREAQRLGLD